jgi:microcystin-dependent protein
MEAYLGMIIMFGGNFPILGWAFCNGQLLPINQNQALFSLLGTTYGGNGTTTFALPDLRGRAPIGFGQGTGLSNIALGEYAGGQTATLTTANLPAHQHPLVGSSLAGNSALPTNAVPANSGNLDKEYSTDLTAPVNMISTGLTGSNTPFGIRDPYMGINYLIALQGIFPPRP